MHNINVLEIAETWVNKSDEPEFSIYMPELVAVGSPMKVFQNNSGPHWLSGYGL